MGGMVYMEQDVCKSGAGMVSPKAKSNRLEPNELSLAGRQRVFLRNMYHDRTHVISSCSLNSEKLHGRQTTDTSRNLTSALSN